MRLIPYIFFDGNCREALDFYVAAGLGTVEHLMASDGGESGAWVMNARLVGDGFELMTSDAVDAAAMTGCALTLFLDDQAKAKALLAALDCAGEASLERQFWGDDFGFCTDRFGVRWQINCAAV